MRILLFILLIFAFSCKDDSIQEPETDHTTAVKNQPSIDKTKLVTFENFHKVNDNIYRSEQPSNEGMVELEKNGIKTVLNLRQFHSDKQEAKKTKLKLEHIKINTWTISYEEVVEALKLIKSSEKPVLVHCRHGSDRTGCVVAASRMVFDNWTKEDAIKEFRNEKYGFHEKYFPNILELLEAINIENLKKEMGV